MRRLRSTIAVGILCLAPVLLGQTPQAPINPLDDVDANFLKAYVARVQALKATNPPFVEVSGSSLFLHIHGKEPIKVRVLTDDPYHHLKDVAHVPFTLYLLLNGRGGTALSDNQLAPLRDFQAKLLTAQAVLDREGFDAEQLGRQRRILDSSVQFVNAVLSSKVVDDAGLKAYARAMAPFMLKNAEEAGCFQVRETHKQMLAWKPLFTDEHEWQSLHVVIKSSHQPRYRDAATQYFAWLLGGTSPAWALPGETSRVIYAESLFDNDTAGDELMDVLVDFEAGRDFFGDDWRMSEDILSNGAAKCIANLHNADRDWHPTPGATQ